ncbi:translation initiation factor IF-2 [Streptomyces sp. bgisy154]|uniref:translation initiation factor IF-2 n=1 Tax=Streptomyces sp. bgisy154 TaxID=3413794 RepID=UPI003D75BFFA
MTGNTPGTGCTPFENMSHEQMLAWLDQANSGQVQAAANRLVAAAKSIRDIAEELKIRPQWVAWKGTGADAFRTWTADLANSTLRLGDFSDDAAKWLTEASGAIAQAQASIPRDTQSATANLAAAKTAHNDPDAAAVARKSTEELQALAAHKEDVRQQAAAQMRKLAQTYTWSATQMNSLERPKFPPPPGDILPEDDGAQSRDLARPTTSNAHVGSAREPGGFGSAGAVAGRPHAPASQPPGVSTVSALPSTGTHTAPDTAPAPRMDIDSFAELPQRLNPTAHAPDVATGPDPVRRGASAYPDPVPPSFANSRATAPPSPSKPTPGGTGPARAVTGPPRQGAPITGPVGPGQATPTGRPPLGPGSGGPGMNSGRMPTSPANGVVGGRPVTPPTGRPTRAIPRGLVVGSEAAPVRDPVGPTTGTPNQTGRVIGQPSKVGGRRQPSSNGTVIGGRPFPQGSNVGDNSQPSGHAGTRGPGTGSSRSTNSGTGSAHNSRTTNAARPSERRYSGGTPAPQQTSPTSDGNRNGRQRQVANEEETGQNADRRTAPRDIG